MTPNFSPSYRPTRAALLVEENGFVAFGGGLHVRGACHEPVWHSLRAAWRGPEAIAVRYQDVQPSDIPFAQDALGDQFLLRDGNVFRLDAETDSMASLEVSLGEFLAFSRRDPVGYLHLEPLLAFRGQGGRLAPGQLLNVYPPYCATYEKDRSFRAVPTAERLRYLASLAAQLRTLPDGSTVTFKVID